MVIKTDERRSPVEVRAAFAAQNPEKLQPRRKEKVIAISWRRVAGWAATVLTIMLGIITWFEVGWRSNVNEDSRSQALLSARVTKVEAVEEAHRDELKRLNASVDRMVDSIEALRKDNQDMFRWVRENSKGR